MNTFTSEFESHLVPNSCGLVLHLSRKLCKITTTYEEDAM